MTFEQKLKSCAALVEETLAAELNAELNAEFNKDLNTDLNEATNRSQDGAPQSGGQSAARQTPQRLKDAMAHAVLGGGKRFRPFLVMESAALFGLPYEASVTTAAALECIHCYSLVHDDLPAMDDDDMRRGRPSVHRAFDEWTAILAGDALLTLAFEIVARPQCHADPAIRSQLVLELAQASGRAGMAGGQQLDLDAEKLHGTDGGDLKTTADVKAAMEAVAEIQAMKTGALIGFACDAGAILGDAHDDARRALARYSCNLGLAYQIADDLLDIEGDPALLGKAVGKDSSAGKATLVSLLGLQAAKAELARVEAEAIAALSIFGPEADALRDAAYFISRRQR